MSPAEAKKTVADVRVAHCITEADIHTSTAARVRLVGVRALDTSGTQQTAQAAVIKALCTEATTNCSTEEDTNHG